MRIVTEALAVLPEAMANSVMVAPWAKPCAVVKVVVALPVVVLKVPAPCGATPQVACAEPVPAAVSMTFPPAQMLVGDAVTERSVAAGAAAAGA
ncbi:MAG TPA: hypothetical protein VLY24_30185 [Bryobacteraceae bacterium]|nr:hypothetical protein [Bryobacteraceae bacterium]